MKNVLIAIPALTWQVNLVLATFLCQTVGRQIGDWNFHLAVLPETSPVHYARNMLVREFLGQPQMSHLWFIDSDMVPETSALAILDTEAAIVTGRCLSIHPGPEGLELTVTAFTDRQEATGAFSFSSDLRDRPIPIVAAGAANLLIRRDVLEDPRMRLAPDYIDAGGRSRSLLDEEGAAPAIFRTLYKPNGQLVLSEDLDFVYRASQLGYPCAYQPAARMGHLKPMDLNQVEQMIRQQIARHRANTT